MQFVVGRYIKRARFCQKWYVNRKGMGLDLRLEPSQVGLEFSFPLIIFWNPTHRCASEWSYVLFQCFFRVCVSKASLFETFKALVSDIPCEKLPPTLRYLLVRTHSGTYMLIPGVYPNVKKKKQWILHEGKAAFNYHLRVILIMVSGAKDHFCSYVCHIVLGQSPPLHLISNNCNCALFLKSPHITFWP